MACLKLEVDDVDEQLFDLDLAVTVKTEEREDIRDLLAQREVDPESSFKTDCYYGDIITIAPLGDLPVKGESVGPNTEYNEFVSVDTPGQDASCQLNSGHDTDTQPVEPVWTTACVHQRPPNTPNSSSSTEAETMKEASHSRPVTSYHGTGSSGSSPLVILMQQKKSLECEIREKQFRHSDDLKQYATVQTDKTDERPHRCQICGDTFKHKCALSLHSLTHKDKITHICQICDKTFTARESLKRHSLTHTEEKPFKCKICDKAFRTFSLLKQHMLTHEKPHKCEMCGKTFSRQRSLDIHSLTHTSEKSFKCKSGDQSSKTSLLLKRHSPAYTGEKPFKCETCGKDFLTCSELNRHSLTHKSAFGNTGKKSVQRRLLPKQPQDTSTNKHLRETIKVYIL